MIIQPELHREAESAGRVARFQCNYFEGFSLLLADTEPLREESFRLRYRVYVDEMAFERREDCPGGLERDRFDRRAIIVLLRHNASRRFIGCVRLIVADADDPTQPFPFEMAAADQFTRGSPAFRQTPRERIGEVSRLAVVHEFRRRRTDQEQGLYSVQDLACHEGDARHNIPPALGLVFAAAWLGIEIGLDAVFVMMEMRLARLLRTLGLDFRQVAEPVEYHGLRAPFEITRESLLGGMSPRLRPALELVREHVLALSRIEVPLASVPRQPH